MIKYASMCIPPKYCQYGVKHHIINQSIHVYGFYLFAFSSRVYSILYFPQNIILILAINPHERALGPHKKAVAILNNYVDSDKYRIFTSKRTWCWYIKHWLTRSSCNGPHYTHCLHDYPIMKFIPQITWPACGGLGVRIPAATNLGSESSTAKRSTIVVSVTSPRIWPL